MSTRDRLGRLERHTTPASAVLAWVARAIEHGSLTDYVGSTLELPASEAPLPRLIATVAAAARASCPPKTDRQGPGRRCDR